MRQRTSEVHRRERTSPGIPPILILSRVNVNGVKVSGELRYSVDLKLRFGGNRGNAIGIMWKGCL
jgi:hypothetical protein